MKVFFMGIGLLLGSIAFAGCAAAPAPPQMEPAVTPQPPTATTAPTETIVWFPPTSTPTPFATQPVTPTLDVRPGAGAVIFQDDFTSGDAWELVQSAAGSAALGEDELTLALHQPGGYLYSLRKEPFLSDFYLEITASPNLCKHEDEYGVLLRVTSSMEFYRFSLSCDGRVRLDKYFNGTASSPQPWLLSGDVPLGAPSSSRLSMWVKGREMRFYINDQHQFTVSDPSLTGGSLGVFVRSGGENALTVNFSDLIVREALD